jgi:hypothetical protein
VSLKIINRSRIAEKRRFKIETIILPYNLDTVIKILNEFSNVPEGELYLKKAIVKIQGEIEKEFNFSTRIVYGRTT